MKDKDANAFSETAKVSIFNWQMAKSQSQESTDDVFLYLEDGNLENLAGGPAMGKGKDSRVYSS